MTNVAASPGEVQERLAELSGAAWTLAAVAAAVEAGVPASLQVATDAATIAARTGLTVPLAGARLAQIWKTDGGEILRADLGRR